MNTRSAFAKGAIVTVLALPLLPLSACSSPEEQVAETLAEQLVESGGAGDVEIDIQDETVTMSDDAGNDIAIGSGSDLPATWPSEIPVFDGGTLLMATVQPDTAASAVWEVDTDVDQAAADYDSQLISSGYSRDQDVVAAGSIIRGYSSEAMTVTVSVSESDGVTTLTVAGAPR